jgi:sphingosine kinase
MWPCSRKHRKRKDFYFLAPRPDEAAKWAAAFESLKCFVNYSPQPLPASKRQASTMDAKESPSPHLATTTDLGRAMLVILNPRSGSGRARKIYDSKVEPVLKVNKSSFYNNEIPIHIKGCILYL